MEEAKLEVVVHTTGIKEHGDDLGIPAGTFVMDKEEWEEIVKFCEDSKGSVEFESRSGIVFTEYRSIASECEVILENPSEEQIHLINLINEQNTEDYNVLDVIAEIKMKMKDEGESESDSEN